MLHSIPSAFRPSRSPIVRLEPQRYTCGQHRRRKLVRASQSSTDWKFSANTIALRQQRDGNNDIRIRERNCIHLLRVIEAILCGSSADHRPTCLLASTTPVARAWSAVICMQWSDPSMRCKSNCGRRRNGCRDTSDASHRTKVSCGKRRLRSATAPVSVLAVASRRSISINCSVASAIATPCDCCQ
ncbi:hypothetical protein ABIB00_007828 [Bradyrhizobium sp. LB14.3]